MQSVLTGLSYCGLSVLQLSSSSSTEVATYSSKILLWTIWTSGFFIFTAFTSDLTAIMTAGASQQLPKSFEDILDREYSIILSKGALAASILANSDPGTPARKVYDKQSKEIVYPLDGNLEPLISQIVDPPRTAYFGTFVQFTKDNRLLVVRDFKDITPTQFQLAFQALNKLNTTKMLTNLITIFTERL